MIKLHLFTHSGREMGHLYSDDNYAELRSAALLLGLKEPYVQKGKITHFDLWGKPLAIAKTRYNIVGNRAFVEDIRKLGKESTV